VAQLALWNSDATTTPCDGQWDVKSREKNTQPGIIYGDTESLSQVAVPPKQPADPSRGLY